MQFDINPFPLGNHRVCRYSAKLSDSGFVRRCGLPLISPASIRSRDDRWQRLDALPRVYTNSLEYREHPFRFARDFSSQHRNTWQISTYIRLPVLTVIADGPDVFLALWYLRDAFRPHAELKRATPSAVSLFSDRRRRKEGRLAQRNSTGLRAN